MSHLTPAETVVDVDRPDAPLDASARPPLDTLDRRRSDRVSTNVPGWISGESNDRGASGRNVSVVDLSMHGVGFHDSRSPYRVGGCHWMIVNGSAMRMSTRIRIVSCRENESGGWDVGAKFF